MVSYCLYVSHPIDLYWSLNKNAKIYDHYCEFIMLVSSRFTTLSNARSRIHRSVYDYNYIEPINLSVFMGSNKCKRDKNDSQLNQIGLLYVYLSIPISTSYAQHIARKLHIVSWFLELPILYVRFNLNYLIKRERFRLCNS